MVDMYVRKEKNKSPPIIHEHSLQQTYESDKFAKPFSDFKFPFVIVLAMVYTICFAQVP
jgi:hypothetical protein